MKVKKLSILFCAVLLSCGTYFQAQNSENVFKNYFSTSVAKNFKGRNLNTYKVDVVDQSKSLNGTVIKTIQLFNNLPIYNTVSTALIKDGKVVYYNDNFVKNYNAASPVNASVNKKDALNSIANDLNIAEINDFQIAEYFEKTTEKNNVAKQRLVYYNVDDNLKLAYEFIVDQPKSPSHWVYIIDANSGNVLERYDLNLSCNFNHGAFDHFHDEVHYNHTSLESVVELRDSSNKANSSSLLVPNPASYNVFKLPLEAATFGSRSIVTNPWIASSSPEGWHSNGVTSYTITRGNNVYAYEDANGTNMIGTSPNGGTTRNFDFPYSLNGTPAANRSASVTNLFYMNNMMHDIYYKFGFTEPARNFQNKNFGLGGLDDDDVYAEAQDGGGLNNANFSSPPDNYNPKMQMYLWSTVNKLVFYNAPTTAQNRMPSAGITAGFAPALTATGVTADVKESPVVEGCTALPAGSLAGKIGLVKRGNCNFDLKVKNLQNAGAVAAIVYNPAPNTPIANMNGADATVTIPAVLINNEEATYMINQINGGTRVNVTLKNDPAQSITPDGSFDNGIIAHEYGHGISNRLTGTGYNCLNKAVDKEQMGEGWSDFFALMITSKPGDNASIPRGIGTYTRGESNDGAGIRPLRYSPDFNVNYATYDHTNGMEYNSGGVMNPDVHSIGFVWATMLWDLHWNYVNKYGYASDVTSNTTNGSSRVLQMVMDGMKLQPCNPSFVEGRDAILAADLAATGGADKCMIWKTFAKRGLGVNASAGLKNNINDQIADFTVPAECLLATEDVDTRKNNITIYPNPAKDEFFINFPTKIMGSVSVKVFDASGKLALTADKVDTKSKAAISTNNLPSGVYIVNIDGLGFQGSTKLIIKK